MEGVLTFYWDRKTSVEVDGLFGVYGPRRYIPYQGIFWPFLYFLKSQGGPLLEKDR